MTRISKCLCVAAALTLCLGSVIQAQDDKKPNILAFGSDSPERGTTRVGYWNRAKQSGAGQFAIDYGRPVWKKDYEDTAKFDSFTKGKTWRMGSNFWTSIDTDMPLTIAGKTVPAGMWYLGLRRSPDGATWSLAFIDPAKARKAHLDASQIDSAPIDIQAPMQQSTAGSTQEKLTIELTFTEPNVQDITLTVSWGNLKLNAPIKVPKQG
jgi:hypothetical protein